MKIVLKSTLALLMYFFCVGSMAIATENWELKTSKDNVDTYIRDVEGSKYRAAKHVAIIDTSLSELFKAIGDGTTCYPWLSLCVSAKVLDQVNKYEYLGYAVIDMPWPVSNRDLVYRSKTTFPTSNGAVLIEQFSEPNSYPSTDMVRMISENTFYVEPLENNQVRFTWIVHSNPGGKVPISLVNSRIHKDTRRDLLSLVEQLGGG